MEKDVLELIRSFEGAAKKMENLDRTVSDFGTVISQLQMHLDELIELVHLEEITALSLESSEKLGQLKSSLDDVLRAKNQAFGRYLYYLADGLHGVDLATGHTWPFSEIKAKKLIQAPIGAFALADAGIYLLENTSPTLILEGPVDDFAVYGNQLLYLSVGNLIRYHLLLKTEQTVMENVLSMELLEPGHALLVTQESGKLVVAM